MNVEAGPGRETAIVIGAGMAGLTTAHVLAEHFQRVLLLDRDTLPDAAVPRRGVPQGQHSHILLVAGQRAIGELFPGIDDDLRRAGAVWFDSGADVHWYRLGAAWQRVSTGLPFVSVSRPLLEYLVRSHVLRHPAITLRTGVAVSGLVGTASRVTGVTLDSGRTITADLVVDCSGQGRRSDRWLAALGLPTPESAEVRVDVGYVSRLYRRAPGDLPVCAAFVHALPPEGKQVAAAMRIEGDRWLVTVGGWHGDYPPPTDEGFTAHARGLPDPIITNLIGRAEPLTAPVLYRFRANRRRFFERLDEIPAGHLALGDAISSLNPLYGQGMTCAMQQALALGRLLAEHPTAPSAELTRAFYRAAAGVLFVPWQAAVSADFDYPQTTGQRPPAAEVFSRRFHQVCLAARTSGPVRRLLLSVQHLVTPPTILWEPTVIAEVARVASPVPEPEPQYGYGAHGRPLWTVADRDAEAARAVLREAGFPEMTDEHRGFAVEGGDPVLVACVDPALLGRGGPAPYAAALTAAGFRVEPSADDPSTLAVVSRAAATTAVSLPTGS